jgi:signal transduction histidine kinase
VNSNHDVGVLKSTAQPAAAVAATLESALTAPPAPSKPPPNLAHEPAPRRHWPFGVRASLSLLLAIGLLPAMVGGAWYLKHLRDMAMVDAFAQVDLLSRTTAESLNWLLQDAQGTMQAIAARPKVKSLDAADCDSIFRDFHDLSPAFKALSVRRFDGTSVCSALAQPPTGLAVAGSDWFQAALSAGGFHASDAHLGPVMQAWAVGLTYPVVGPTGRAEALLISPVDLDALRLRLFGHLVPPAVVAVVDGANKIIVRSERQADRVGKPAAQSLIPVLEALRQDQPVTRGGALASRQFIETGIEGKRNVFALVRVPATEWVVVAALPESQALEGYLALRGQVAVALGLVLAGVAFAAWRVSRAILVPVRGLAAAARAVGLGDTARRAPESGPREIREVAGEFNRMVAANHAAGEQLRASERQYRTLIHHMPVAVITFRTDGAIEVFNERACTLLKMTSREMEGASASDPQWQFVDGYGQTVPSAFHPVRRVLQAGRAIPPVLLGVVPKTGRAGPPAEAVGPASPHTWVMVTAYPQFDESGPLVRVIALFVDFTAQRQADELRVAKESAEAASRAKSLFLSRVSHELRTPLNAINGFSELMLLDAQAPAPVKDKVRHIFDAGRHLLALINQMMDLSRLEAGTLRANSQRLDLWQVVRECVAICGPMAQAHGVALGEATARDEAGPQAVWVLADATQVRQILINLLSNAIKYNKPGGRVQVGPDTDPHHGPRGIGLAVTDTGIGLSAADLPGLFQPFNRLGAGLGAIEGHGLGLAISRELARAMGGDITVRSNLGEGSVFTLWLPPAGPTGPPG